MGFKWLLVIPLTSVVPSGSASIAFGSTARKTSFEAHAIACFPSSHALAYRDDFAGAFVSSTDFTTDDHRRSNCAMFPAAGWLVSRVQDFLRTRDA